MNKSVYSLVLMDSIVDEIDKIAYMKNTSRSNVINQILADHLSYSTPEKKISDIFDNLQSLINHSENFQVINQASPSMFSVKSSIKYKYKPTARYSVELYRNSNSVVGELKVSFRTQNTDLIEMLNGFFRLWSELEDKYISKYFPGNKIERKIEDGRFTRILILPLNENFRTNECIGQAIGEYIRMFDEILKTYFSYADDIDTAREKVGQMYISYLKQGIIIM